MADLRAGWEEMSGHYNRPGEEARWEHVQSRKETEGCFEEFGAYVWLGLDHSGADDGPYAYHGACVSYCHVSAESVEWRRATFPEGDEGRDAAMMWAEHALTRLASMMRGALTATAGE